MKPHHLLAILTFIIPVISFSQTAEEFYNEGKKLKDEKKSAEAIKKYQAALDLNPGYTDARYEMGWCYNDTKDYFAAIRTLRLAMPAMKEVYKANFEMGYAFEKTDSYDSALYYYNRCLAITTTNAGVYKQMGFIAYQKEEYPKALE